MSRARMLKPEFFTDSSVVRCSPLARIFFMGSWCWADDNGIIPDDMLQLKMQVLPGDTVDGEELKCELVQAGLWVPYISEERRYILIRSFCAHQVLDRPRAVWPLPDADTLTPLGLIISDRTYTKSGRTVSVRCLADVRTASGQCPDSDRPPRKEQKGREKKRREEKGKDGEENAVLVAEFVEKWNSLGDPFPAIRNLGTRRDSLNVRLKEEFFRANWRDALEKMRGCAFCRGENDRAWVADVEFFIRPDSCAKILEGKYDRNGNVGKPTQPQDDDPDGWRETWDALHGVKA